MTTQEKIEAIKNAIVRAEHLDSKMDATAWAVPALSSLRIRHLMNNLGAISTRYLESGVHKGGLFCSTIRHNANIDVATANDNWASDVDSEDKAHPQFIQNAYKCKSDNTNLAIIIGDSFGEEMDKIINSLRNVDLYLFDASHDYESQKKGVIYFLSSMADEFILCVDDYDWEDVWKGTQDGLKDAGIEILYEHAFIGNDHDNDGWWNGFYVALLKKKSI